MSRPLLLCATDLTDEGARAVDLALSTARAVGGEVLLLHTCDPIPEAENVPASVAPGVETLRERLVARRASAEAALEAERARCAGEGVPTSSLLVDGPSADAILKAARERNAGLVVLGRRHRTEGFVGKTIDHVVRAAPCPVFVAPPDAPAPKSLENARWVVGVDFSPQCLHAVHATRAFVSACGGEIRLVQVVQPAGGEDLSYGERTPAQILREEGLREDHAKLEALAASAAPTAEVVQVRALERPSTELCRVAEEMDATAVVVGTHGRSGVARFFLGSTAERLLRHATRPVLVLREAPTTASPWYEPPILPATHLGPRRMLVAVDFSEPSKRAIAFARSLAAKLRIAVEVVHVYDAIVAGASSAPGAPANEVRAMLTTRLDELVRDVFGPDASTVRTHLVPGRPIDAILDLARKREADLVVVGTTGRTGIERMLLGSTAERLVRESAVPILTIH